MVCVRITKIEQLWEALTETSEKGISDVEIRKYVFQLFRRLPYISLTAV